ncbi:hypothetical protein B0H21DRAFT_706548 [Amylocystis lapponica]|nr:hypothetical protein B0H21DRAFT_706548 [Amylocystis lapponica]
MSDFHEAFFKWPHPEASTVIVTGTFDQARLLPSSWSGSVHLPKNGAVFEGPVKVPWGEKVTYKYIVDGRWTTTDDQPVETDPMGNLNNVYTSPSKPAPPHVPEPVLEEKPVLEKYVSEEKPAEPTVTSAVFGLVETAKETAVAMVEAIAPGTTGEATLAVETPTGAPKLASPVSEPEPQPASAPAAEPSSPPQITAEAVLPAKPEAETVAPIVFVPLLPLSTEPPTNGDSTPAPEADVSASKPLETTVIENSATAEPPATTPAAPEASTHTPATNGVAPTSPASPKTNGVAHPASASTSAASLATPPSKGKGMRFPSIRSTSQRSSNGSASEFGEKAKGTHAGRVDSAQRKKRNSIFGKLKDIFHSDSPPRK